MSGSGQGLRGTALRGFANGDGGMDARVPSPIVFCEGWCRLMEQRGGDKLRRALGAPFWHPVLSEAWILDWDGVLAATHLSFAPLYERFFGGQRVMLLEALPTLEPDQREELAAMLVSLEMEGAERAEAVPGARDLVAWIERHELPWAVVSRNCRGAILRAAEVMGLPLPPLVFSREEEPVKPDPEALRRAARTLGVSYGSCVVVGDYLYDILGARRAGMRAILVERGPESWDHWADVAFPRVVDLVVSCGSPQPLLPWEYATLDPGWLESAWHLCGHLPEDSPLLGGVVERACALGMGTLAVSAGKSLTPEQWKAWRGLPAEWMGLPVEEVVRKVCGERFPLVTVAADRGDHVSLPPDPDALHPLLCSMVEGYLVGGIGRR